MIQILYKITEDQSAALLRLKDGVTAMMPALARGWAGGAQEVLGRAVKNRFSGEGPFPVAQNRLGIASHRLRKSLRTTPVQVNPDAGTASISMGSNVKYYPGHEFGFRGRVQVNGHTRRAVADAPRNARGKLTKKQQKRVKESFKRGRAGFSYVKPHARRVNIPARRPLGTELESLQTRLTFYKRFAAVLSRILKTK